MMKCPPQFLHSKRHLHLLTLMVLVSCTCFTFLQSAALIQLLPVGCLLNPTPAQQRVLSSISTVQDAFLKTERWLCVEMTGGGALILADITVKQVIPSLTVVMSLWWIQVYFTAPVVDCGEPQPPISGTLISIPNTVAASEVIFQCNDGLFPRGQLTAVCMSDGRWSPDPTNVECHIQSCEMRFVYRIISFRCHHCFLSACIQSTVQLLVPH